jgi:plasmid stability protein
MAVLTVRNVPDEVHRALKARASEHGRSAEAEVRDILQHALISDERVHMGDQIAALGRELGLTDEDVDAIEQNDHPIPAVPMDLP